LANRLQRCVTLAL